MYVPSSIDIWSCGVILFLMLAGYLPFDDQSGTRLQEKIKRADCKHAEWVSPQSRTFIDRFLVVDAAKRVTLAEARSDPWVVEGEAVALEAENRLPKGMFDGIGGGGKKGGNLKDGSACCIIA